MAKYRRVALADRYQIQTLLKSKISIKNIAESLDFHKTTIYRELKRNSEVSYTAKIANKKAQHRFFRCRPNLKLDEEMIGFIRTKIINGWSAEQISGRMRIEKNFFVSHETIYKYIRRVYFTDFSLKAYSRRPRRKGKGRYLVRNHKPSWFLRITDRPLIINQRERLGDWERDTMYASDSALLVLTDRKSRYTKLGKLEDKKAITIYKKTHSLLSGLKLLSITNDNGSEFGDAVYQKIPIYFCNPYKPQQRGTVENTIGLIRQYVGRKALIKSWSEDKLLEIEDMMNLRPRKCLGFKTPYEVHFNKSVALVG